MIRVPSRRLASPLIAALGLSLTGLSMLSACMGAPAGGHGPQPITPTSRFTLQVETGMDRIALSVHEDGLSDSQVAALRSLAGRYVAAGAPLIRVEAPGGVDEVSNRFAWSIKEALTAMGVPGEVQVAAYAAPDPRAPVVVGFETLRAHVPQCGTQWDNLSRTANNATSSNFGCAVTANLAAQIANPRDIVQPRAITPTDASRRTVVFDHYRKGERISAPQEVLVAQGRASQAVD
jgi:pilus assembly protein CpaD